MNNNCLNCHSQLPELPILKFNNMPKSAQYFPTNENIHLDQGVDLAIYQCPYCSLIQSCGEPVAYYRDVIRATGVSQEMHQFREKQFKEFVRKHHLEGKKVIEIGAGCGEYMKIMQMTGVQVVGLEHLEASVIKGNKEQLLMHQGFVEDSGYFIPEAPYDAFYCLNFLEHIPNPDQLLKGIFHNLTVDSVGLVEVPNVNMILDKMLFSEFISDHLMYFTKETLTALLETNGFEVIECQVIWYDYIISATVRRKTEANTQRFLLHQKKITDEINHYIEEQKQSGKRVAVWGAGHQALAVLSLANLTKKVEVVIDSAEFKQNKLTPATHIPTVSPDILKNGEIGAVLIMAAGYSDEIAYTLQNQYTDIAIAILRDYGIEVVKK